MSSSKILMLLWVFALFLFFPSRSVAQNDFEVSLGQNKVFQTCNFHDTQYELKRGVPRTIEFWSEGQEGVTHILAESYQEGWAKSWVGVEFFVSPESNCGNTSWEAEIFLTLEYTLNVDFQVPPPSEQGGGSVDAIVYGSIAGNLSTVDRIHFVHYSNPGKKP